MALGFARWVAASEGRWPLRAMPCPFVLKPAHEAWGVARIVLGSSASQVGNHTWENAMPEKLTVDLHPIFRSDRDIDNAVRNGIFRAAGENVPLVEIIPGKGAGKLKKRVLAMLKQPHIKKLYRSVEVAPGNDGMVLVHLR